jgi:hypothetical protein
MAVDQGDDAGDSQSGGELLHDELGCRGVNGNDR